MIDWTMILCSFLPQKTLHQHYGACIFLNKNLMQLFSLSKGLS